jgi:hypothetical protein
MSSVSVPAPPKRRRRVLDPSERSAEVLFGVIMVLTFTGSLSAATSGREEVRTMLIGAVGCNLAWGIVDAIMYLMGALNDRGRRLFLLRRVLGDADARRAVALVADYLPPLIVSVLTTDELDAIRRRLAALPFPARRPALTREDLRGALGVFLLVFLSTFPIVIPFLVMREARPALRASNAVAIVMLYLAGSSVGRFAGFRPWKTGLGMVLVGLILVALTIALGG